MTNDPLDYTTLDAAHLEQQLGALIYDTLFQNTDYNAAATFDDILLECECLNHDHLTIIVDLANNGKNRNIPDHQKIIKKYDIKITEDTTFDPADYEAPQPE